MFESSGAVDFSRAGAHLIQDTELVLVTSTLVGGIYFTQFVDCSSEIGCGDLSVSTNQELKNCIMDEDVLILYARSSNDLIIMLVPNSK